MILCHLRRRTSEPYGNRMMEVKESLLLAQVHFANEKGKKVLDLTSSFTKIEAFQPSLHVT
jgi:hypothetical protein